MMASGEIRLSATTMRRMPVLAQSETNTGPSADGIPAIVVTASATNNAQSQPFNQFNPYPALTNNNYFAVQALPTNYGVSVSPRSSRYANPNLQKNIGYGAAFGSISVGTIGALVTLNILGWPEVEAAEAGEAVVGFGAWLEALSEPMSSMSVGTITGAFIGGSVGGAGGYLVTPPFPY